MQAKPTHIINYIKNKINIQINRDRDLLHLNIETSQYQIGNTATHGEKWLKESHRIVLFFALRNSTWLSFPVCTAGLHKLCHHQKEASSRRKENKGCPTPIHSLFLLPSALCFSQTMISFVQTFIPHRQALTCSVSSAEKETILYSRFLESFPPYPMAVLPIWY